MAGMAPAATSGAEFSITVEPTVNAGATGGGEVRQQSEEQQRESVVSAAMVRRKMKRLNMIVFGVALFEWAGNVVGTLAFLWATVVLLGGFSSLLSRIDFWFATVMVFVEGSRVFIRNDASVNQWLFGSTRAFRWENLSFPRMLVQPNDGNLIAVIIGVGIGLAPLNIHPQITAGILKLSSLIIISQLLARLREGWFARVITLLLLAAAACGSFYRFYKMMSHKRTWGSKHYVFILQLVAWIFLWVNGIGCALQLIISILSRTQFKAKPIPLLCLKVIAAIVLACFPFLQPKLASHYTYVSISVAVVLLMLTNSHEDNDSSSEQNDSSSEIWEHNNTSSCGLLLQIIETILPVLFFWSVMFPLPGISIKISFYMLFSVIAAVLVANLQMPVAFLQVLLSILRLRSLLGPHHHNDYRPLPDGASPNLVPSIVIFFMLELCQGSSYIMAVILGLISLFLRRSLVRDLQFQEQWGVKAVDLYHHQAYQARTERGLFPSETHTPSLTSFAIETLGSTSSEMQIVGLHVLHNFLERWDAESRNELITEITYASKKAVPTIIDMLGSTAARHQDIRLLAAKIIHKLSGSLRISEFPGMVKLTSSLLDAENRQDSMLNHHVPENNGGNDSERQLLIERWVHFYLLGLLILEKLAFDPDNCAEIAKDATNIITKVIRLIIYLIDENNNTSEIEQQEKVMVYESALKLVSTLAVKGGKTGARFRHELSENALLLNSLERILDMEGSKPELREVAIDIIAKLALDEATKQEIGSTQPIIHKLMDAFRRPDDINPSEDNDGSSLRLTAGEALANITIMSTDNCWAILLAKPRQRYNLIENLTNMLENEYYMCVAANLLHNLCTNSRDKLIDLGANVHLESALTKVMQIIRTKEGKQLEAALCVASQIGYVIPEYFAQMLESDPGAAAEELVEKLVHTLISKPCLEYPRIRRVLVEVVILIVDLCPGYIKIFREKGAKGALDMVKGTPSRCEKYRVFLNGEGLITESIPMRDLIDKAKRLIYQATPMPSV